MKHYIYAIYHISKKKYYIGETCNFPRRFYDHLRFGERGYENFNSSYEKRGLYLAINKYGITDFMFKVLEICETDEKVERESYWINKYKSNGINGYNTLCGIDSKKFYKKIVENIDIEEDKKSVYELVREMNAELNIPKNYIDTELLIHEKKIKNFTNNGEKATNIVLIKEKSTGKGYICTSTSYTSNSVLNRKFKGKNLRKDNSMYMYLQDKDINDFEVIFLENRVSQKSAYSGFTLYESLIKNGYDLDDLLFESQKKQLFKHMEYKKDNKPNMPKEDIDENLLVYDKTIKTFTNDDKKYTNIVMIKEKLTGKGYICTSTSDIPDFILNSFFRGKSLKKDDIMYMYLQGKEKIDFEVIFLKHRVSRKNACSGFILCESLVKNGYDLDDLLFESQKEQLLKYMEYKKI